MTLFSGPIYQPCKGGVADVKFSQIGQDYSTVRGF